MTKIPPAPTGSGRAGRKLWRAVLEQFELEEHEATLLERACRVADSCAALQAIVDREGVMSADRFGATVPHPALVELRQQSMVLARLIVALRVPLGEQTEQDGAPVVQRGQRRGLRGVHGLGVAK